MQKNTWTGKENTVLRKLYSVNNLSDAEISRHLPGRTANAVRIQRSTLGLVSYTKTKGYKRNQKAPFVRGAAKLPEGTQPTLFPVAKKNPKIDTETVGPRNIIRKAFSEEIDPPANIDLFLNGSILISIAPGKVFVSGMGVGKEDVARILGLIISKII